MAASPDRSGCGALVERLGRQNAINTSFSCNLKGTAWRLNERQLKRLASSCRRGNSLQLRVIANDRASGLEICLAKRGERERQQTERRKIAAQRLSSLLAWTPTQANRRQPLARQAAPRGVFNPELTWSFAGPISGMSCVRWNEPSDPHDWADNYLCSDRDYGFAWSFRGPIRGRGLNCTQVKEAADPHTWHDNFFCWPRNLGVAFRFSSGGRLPNHKCTAIIEPSDPHKWYDNFLCYRPDPKALDQRLARPDQARVAPGGGRSDDR